MLFIPVALPKHTRRFESDISVIERKIYDLETSYFEECAGYNFASGWGGFTKWVPWNDMLLPLPPPTE